jgi:hypothetical protein
MNVHVMDFASIAAAALADSLDALASGVFLVDAAGRITHANASGHMMVAEGDVVHAPNGKLRATDRLADRALRCGLEACCSDLVSPAHAVGRVWPEPHSERAPARGQGRAPMDQSRECRDGNGTDHDLGRGGIAVPFEGGDGERYVATDNHASSVTVAGGTNTRHLRWRSTPS